MSHVVQEDDARSSPLRKIDRVAVRFEQEWRQRQRPRIADFLGEVAPELRQGLLVELVYMDIEHRGRNDLPVSIDDYFQAFPELEHLTRADVVNLVSHIERHCGDSERTKSQELPASGPAPPAPVMIGRFPIAGQLASSGQADVFLSFHPELKVPVVVKWQRIQGPPDPAEQEHLLREWRILAGLEAHPNLVRAYELGIHDGRPFLVLEQIQGSTLDQYAQAERVSPRRSAEIVAALAEAAHSAHRQGIVHQDMKPSNVLIDGRGQPRLIDFGLAKLRSAWSDPDTDAGPTGGTLAFLSPEQADPAIGPISPRTDVFGLGAVLYFLLTGRPLYERDNLLAMRARAAQAAYDETALEHKAIPKRIAAVCRKALARDSAGRNRTAPELAAALRVAVRPPAWPRVAGLAALFLIAVGGGWWLGQAPNADLPASPLGAARALHVRVWRAQTQSIPLSGALPLHTGDQVQARFRVPAGLHVALCSINGRGQLKLLKQYPPQRTETELIFPGADQYSELTPPEGTETLLVCGRAGAAVSDTELLAMWDAAAPWPAFDRPEQLLRMQADHVREEGERARDFGTTHHHAGSDAVAGRLESLRARLNQEFTFFEGLAFAHL